MKKSLGYLLWFMLGTFSYAPAQQSVTDQQPSLESVTLSTDSSALQRFIAVHGQRAVLMGYSEQGLEAWAYPFQILSGYRVGFQIQGITSEIDGRMLLRRVIYSPDSITRVYIGSNYIVYEKLFVPIDQTAAIISYEVKAPQPIDIVVHFTPVLNLMWPAAVGGQSTAWNPEASGYVISEPADGTSAVVASPQIVAHDHIANSTLRLDNALAFTLRPAAVKTDSTAASVFIALNPPDKKDSSATVRSLTEHLPDLESQAKAHYGDLERATLNVQTPDEQVNQSLAWANIALDQAWVCNPTIGCGTVAGYGPSRNERRPQYDWFFAGDGLVAVQGLLAAGQYSRARDELEFISRYQDKNTGMIWHELSQSAGYIDWSKYPYMFVHVDISFDYLAVVARYVSVTGDTALAREHWSSIAAAYSYCQSIVRPSDHLPHIPADKEGGNEQERPDDDLGLSLAWIEATAGFADLANSTGHKQAADSALNANQLARTAVVANYWDSTHHFWIDGHTASGGPIFTRRGGAGSSILQNIFSAQQNEELLDQLASAKFQTDWGMRGVAADSSIFDPYSYATGSVSALSSTNAALTFWKAHRPDAAFSLWSSILPWNTLDSLGHLHEVVAGNYYHQQLESVPEQTWSSAGLLDATVRGLLGLDVDGLHDKVTFAPHLPAQWTRISVKNIHLTHSSLDFTLRQTTEDLDLEIKNTGAPVKILFEPGLPLGARLVNADTDGHAANAVIQHFPEEDRAHLEIDAPSGVSHCHLRFVGGASLILNHHPPQLGDTSTGLKITNLQRSDNTLLIKTDIFSTGDHSFQVRTASKITGAQGAAIKSISDDIYELTVPPAPAGEDQPGYKTYNVWITFADTDH
jgi:glycogen debranching enzyme